MYSLSIRKSIQFFKCSQQTGHLRRNVGLPVRDKQVDLFSRKKKMIQKDKLFPSIKKDKLIQKDLRTSETIIHDSSTCGRELHHQEAVP